MILRLSRALFEAPSDADQKLLRQLFALVEPDDHRAVLVDDAGDEQGAFARWSRSLDPVLRAHVEDILRWGALGASALPELGADDAHSPMRWRRAGALNVRVAHPPKSDWVGLSLTLHDAKELLQEPMHLRLENERNDFAFLRVLAKDRQAQELRELEAAPARMVIHSGGTGEIRVFLKNLHETETLDTPTCRRLWRTWIMFDKDAGDFNAEDYGDAILDLIDLCEKVENKHKIPVNWVCLQRREIESYLPESFLRYQRGQQSALAKQLLSWRRRADRQSWAWCFDMKRGLKGDLLPNLPKERARDLREPTLKPAAHELKAPFASLSPREIQALSRGFGKHALTDALGQAKPPSWLADLGNEYDQGPQHQLARDALIQSLLDRS